MHLYHFSLKKQFKKNILLSFLEEKLYIGSVFFLSKSMSLRVGLFGFGNVGGGVGKIIFEECKTDPTFPITLAKVCVRNVETIDKLGLPEDLFTTNGNSILEDSSVDVIVEAIGGNTFAKMIIETALNNKKHVVTANKALLAECGNELFALAKENGVFLKFEASVGGGIPIIRTLQTHYSAGNISKVAGIVNGTCNFILSEIESKGLNYADVLKEAQKNGFAESDPTFDVEGYDAAQKLAILAHLSFGVSIPCWKEISTHGISQLHSADFSFAKEMGKRIRLVVSAEKNREANTLFLSVSPAMVPAKSTLGSITGPTNVITISHEYLGDIALKGAGAGRYPTAASVLSDLFSIARKEDIKNSSYESSLQLSKNSAHEKSFYFRFFVEDKPGVLASVAEVFSEARASISEIKNAKGDELPMSILTYPISSLQKEKILTNLSSLQVIKGSIACLEVL